MNNLFIPPSGPKRHYRHGHKPAGGASPEYVVWNAMRARCTNPKNPTFPRYGGRGIKVCAKWREDFVAFLNDMGKRPSPQHSIERNNNDGNYEPGNCRWATPTEQSNNRRSNLILTFKGEQRTAAEWSRIMGISQSTIHARLHELGWTTERALTQPVPAKTKRA